MDGCLPDPSPARRPVSLRDIAEALGVDVSTVSRGLRNDPRVTLATRNKVHGMAATLGYRPNPFVRAFSAQLRSRRLDSAKAELAAVYVKSPDSPEKRVWFQTYLDGVRKGAAAQGFLVEPMGFTVPEIVGGKMDRILTARGIRGVVLMPMPQEAQRLPLNLEGRAWATIDQSLQEPPMHRATPDYFAGMTLALAKLAASGRRRIGFCTSASELRRIGSRWDGAYRHWQASLPERDRLPVFLYAPVGAEMDMERSHGLWKSTEAAFREWLEASRPDAIVTNILAVRVWLANAGVRTPEEIEFVSLGWSRERSAVSCVDQQFGRVGLEAANLVASQIYRNEYGAPEVPTMVLVPPVWVERNGHRPL